MFQPLRSHPREDTPTRPRHASRAPIQTTPPTASANFWFYVQTAQCPLDWKVLRQQQQHPKTDRSVSLVLHAARTPNINFTSPQVDRRTGCPALGGGGALSASPPRARAFQEQAHYLVHIISPVPSPRQAFTTGCRMNDRMRFTQLQPFLLLRKSYKLRPFKTTTTEGYYRQCNFFCFTKSLATMMPLNVKVP